MPEKSTIALIDEHFRHEAERAAGQKTLPRVLLIDDDEDFNLQVRQAFSRKNIIIDCAINGHEGLNLALARDYDLIILDMRLPGLTGIEVFRRLKNAKPSSRVVICTQYPNLEDVREAIKIGCFGLMAKPVDVLALSDVFRHYNLDPDIE